MTDRHPSFERAAQHFNQPVIDFLTVVRLIGWGQDSRDCHYIYHSPYRGIYRSSAVGSFIPLSARDDFDQLDKWLAINGAPKAEAFLIEETE